MNDISKFGRNKVALANAFGRKSADNDARGAAPTDESSLVPPTTQPPPGDLNSVRRAPRVSFQLPSQTWFLDAEHTIYAEWLSSVAAEVSE